jgi:hypothetical protein
LAIHIVNVYCRFSTKKIGEKVRMRMKWVDGWMDDGDGDKSPLPLLCIRFLFWETSGRARNLDGIADRIGRGKGTAS